MPPKPSPASAFKGQLQTKNLQALQALRDLFPVSQPTPTSPEIDDFGRVVKAAVVPSP